MTVALPVVQNTMWNNFINSAIMDFYVFSGSGNFFEFVEEILMRYNGHISNDMDDILFDTEGDMIYFVMEWS